VAVELMMDTGRRPEETCELPWDCLERDKDGKYVLVYDNLKCQRRRRELPHHRHQRSADHRPAAARP
jgi:hypothetical protein